MIMIKKSIIIWFSDYYILFLEISQKNVLKPIFGKKFLKISIIYTYIYNKK